MDQRILFLVMGLMAAARATPRTIGLRVQYGGVQNVVQESVFNQV